MQIISTIFLLIIGPSISRVVAIASNILSFISSFLLIFFSFLQPILSQHPSSSFGQGRIKVQINLNNFGARSLTSSRTWASDPKTALNFEGRFGRCRSILPIPPVGWMLVAQFWSFIFHPIGHRNELRVREDQRGAL